MAPILSEDQYDRLPGLFRAWELGGLIAAGKVYRIEDAGMTDDGQPLHMVFAAPDVGSACKGRGS